MTIERLKELKEQILTDLRSAIHRRSELHDQFLEFVLDYEITKLRAVVDLIDAEIERQEMQMPFIIGKNATCNNCSHWISDAKECTKLSGKHELGCGLWVHD